MEYIGKENNTSEINRKLDALEDILLDDKTDNSNIKKLKKKLIADSFFTQLSHIENHKFLIFKSFIKSHK